MPRAVAVRLPEQALQISFSPRGYQSPSSHAGERIRPETNCYLDLWIATLHAHLPAATPYSVRLRKVASADSLGTATITASA
jgi:hypothetical protein